MNVEWKCLHHLRKILFLDNCFKKDPMATLQFANLEVDNCILGVDQKWRQVLSGEGVKEFVTTVVEKNRNHGNEESGHDGFLKLYIFSFKCLSYWISFFTAIYKFCSFKSNNNNNNISNNNNVIDLMISRKPSTQMALNNFEMTSIVRHTFFKSISGKWGNQAFSEIPRQFRNFFSK